MPPDTSPGQLTWVVALQDDSLDNIETAFALDATYVYRRETDLSQATPESRYYLAEHREVLADDVPWDQGRFWEPCDETGTPIGKRFRVRVTFEHVAVVHAIDAEAARIQGVGRVNLPNRLRANVRATATRVRANG